MIQLIGMKLKLKVSNLETLDYMKVMSSLSFKREHKMALKEAAF